jgi:general secretion pathway protein D
MIRISKIRYFIHSIFAGAVISALMICCQSGFAQKPIPAPPDNLLTGPPPLQVLIEVLLADISHDLGDEVGVQHEFIDSGKNSISLYNDAFRLGSGAEYETRTQTGDLGSIITRFPLSEKPDKLFEGLDIVGRVIDVDSGELFTLIQALSTAGKGEILSRPSIVTLDSQQANIDIGQKVPYLTRKIASQREIFVSEEVDTGINLRVTPNVMKNDEGQYFVQMQVNPEVRFISGNRKERDIELPIVATRAVSTSVIVASGKTFILGGLYRDNERRTVNGVPGLSRVPYVGGLFRSTSRKKIKSELIISITPTVLDPSMVPERGQSVLRSDEKQIPRDMQMKLLQGWGEIDQEADWGNDGN